MSPCFSFSDIIAVEGSSKQCGPKNNEALMAEQKGLFFFICF